MTPAYYKKQYESELKDLEEMSETEATKYVNTKIKFANDWYTCSDMNIRFIVAYNYKIAAYYAELKSWQGNKKNKRWIPIKFMESDAGELYHFAGHHFRFLENYNLAADSYKSAGDCSSHNLKWAIRCYARAKVCFQDIGESEKADKAYYEEQEARRRLARKSKNKLPYLWYEVRKMVTNYGGSITRLSVFFLIILVLFTFLYCITAFLYKWPTSFSWERSIWRGVYSYIAIATGFGEIINKVPWQAKIIILFNIVSGYLMLALAIDIIVKKFKDS